MKNAPITAVVSEVTGATPDRPSYGVNIRIHDNTAGGNGKSAAPPPDARASAAAGARAEAVPRRGLAAWYLRRLGEYAVLRIARMLGCRTS